MSPRVSTYDEPQDYYLLLGERYKGTKDAIRKAATVGRFDELTELLTTQTDLGRNSIHLKLSRKEDIATFFS